MPLVELGRVREILWGIGISGMSDEQGLAVIFSLRDGDVWASRFGGCPPTMLGPHDQVIEAMHDFIGQADFAQRLFDKAAHDRIAGA